jgi:hypothetical protein
MKSSIVTEFNLVCDMEWKVQYNCIHIYFFVYFLGGLECVGHSFAYVAHFVFFGDVWIRTQRAAVASRCATNLATHLPQLSHLSSST